MFSFKLKCVQLDLARQIETMNYVKEFFDFASAAGYNAVLLYLEDRVRTESYHLQADGEAYSPDQIKEMTAYAKQKNLELIPCVATLGHAERFLAHPELTHLSEGQGKLKNKFGNDAANDVFCITNPDFYPFMEKYLQEVASLFPSSLFHAGLDEFFNFNLCERCRKAMPEITDEEQMFLQHIIRIHDCLKKWGKRMMMWSDMFEIYTHVLPQIPKDVIVVDWQYQGDVRFYLGHLFEMGVEDRIAQNNALGLTTVFAPAERILGNTESAIEYARKKEIPDFLVTSWEKTDTFLYRSFPIIFYAGRLLNGVPPDAAWKEMMTYLFGAGDDLLSSAVRLIVSSGNMRHFQEVSTSSLFDRPFTGLPLHSFAVNQTAQKMLLAAEDNVQNELGKKVWKDLWNVTEEKRISSELKRSFWDVFDFGFAKESLVRAEQAEKDFHTLIQSKSEDWKQYRNTIPGNIFEKRKESLFAGLRKNIETLSSSSFLFVRFCMPDMYAVNAYSVEVLENGTWRSIAVKKAGKYDAALYEEVTCFECKGLPQAIRLHVDGMGGRGIAYAYIKTASGEIYVPDAVLETSGTVEHPQYMLEDDSKFTWFHTQTTRFHYHHLQFVSEDNTISLSLKKKNPADGLELHEN